MKAVYDDLDRACALAWEYRNLLRERGGRACEPRREWDAFTERHLQCVWVDDRLRPRDLKTSDGETVLIRHSGHWNREKGPDFLDAEWEVEGRRFRGDVEIHIRPMDWRRHGHAADPAYAGVGLHVTYEPGDLPESELPPGCVQVSLRPSLEKRSHFFFDAIDPNAYPENREDIQSGLREVFARATEEEQGRLLEAAGQERIRRKALRFCRCIRAAGTEQALFLGLVRGLGYKHNAEPAEALARALPVENLREWSRGDSWTAYALLLGTAGLLPAGTRPPGFPDWIPVRRLWDLWWPHQSRFLGRSLSLGDWRLDGCRPGNHPWRRLWAAAVWACGPRPLAQAFELRPDQSDRKWIRTCMDLLQVRAPKPDPTPRVVGPPRAGALFLNTLAPWRISAMDRSPEADFWTAFPSEPLNAKSRRAAHALFGPDVHPRVFRGGLRRQGLLQFHEDFGC